MTRDSIEPSYELMTLLGIVKLILIASTSLKQLGRRLLVDIDQVCHP